jgi:CRISPR-associated protein Csb2
MEVARFSLHSTLLPPVTETLPVSESARRVCMGIYGRIFAGPDGTRARSAIFSGKDDGSVPLQGHGHAYYLPTDEDSDGRLDHLTIIANHGFGANELRVLERLRELRSFGSEHSCLPLRTSLLGLGRLDDYQPFPLYSSRVWVSVTPFIASRYLKKRGAKRDPKELWCSFKDFLVVVLREELIHLIGRRPDLRDVSPCDIQIVPLIDKHGVFRTGTHKLRPIQFERFRHKVGDDGGNRPAGFFRIDFGCQVQGPIALGHSCHFGLGLFAPAA